jgi:hypothetical protein
MRIEFFEGRPGFQQDAENNLSRRSRLANILNVPHSENELSWQVGVGG